MKISRSFTHCPCYDLMRIHMQWSCDTISSFASETRKTRYSLSLFLPLSLLFIYNRAILLTNNAMFGNIISSSSVPLLIFGTYSNGWSSRAVTVLLSLNRTFACSNDSLKIYQNLSFFLFGSSKIQFFSRSDLNIVSFGRDLNFFIFNEIKKYIVFSFSARFIIKLLN